MRKKIITDYFYLPNFDKDLKYMEKKVLEEMFENPREPEGIVKENGWAQISDEGEIKKIVCEIIDANPQSVADFKSGKDRALGFLVGQAMKATKGKANPQLLNKLFVEEMNK